MNKLILISVALLITLTGCKEVIDFKVNADIPKYVLSTADIFMATTSTDEQIIVFYGPGFKECRLDVDINGTPLTNYVVYPYGSNTPDNFEGEKIACVDIVIPYVTVTDVSDLRVLK